MDTDDLLDDLIAENKSAKKVENKPVKKIILDDEDDFLDGLFDDDEDNDNVKESKKQVQGTGQQGHLANDGEDDLFDDLLGDGVTASNKQEKASAKKDEVVPKKEVANADKVETKSKSLANDEDDLFDDLVADNKPAQENKVGDKNVPPVKSNKNKKIPLVKKEEDLLDDLLDDEIKVEKVIPQKPTQPAPSKSQNQKVVSAKKESIAPDKKEVEELHNAPLNDKKSKVRDTSFLDTILSEENLGVAKSGGKADLGVVKPTSLLVEKKKEKAKRELNIPLSYKYRKGERKKLLSAHNEGCAFLSKLNWRNLNVDLLSDEEVLEIDSYLFIDKFNYKSTPRYRIESERRRKEKVRITNFVKKMLPNWEVYVREARPIEIDGKEYFADKFGDFHLVTEPSCKKIYKNIPLHKSEMEEVRITPDGKTLADVLPHLRTGAQKFEKTVQDIIDNTKEITFNNSIHGSQRYLKHAAAVQRRRKREKERLHKSQLFIQRNAKNTQEEKIIMRNLGMTTADYNNFIKNKNIPNDDRLKVLAAGMKGEDWIFKGAKYRTTSVDTDILEFLAKFKFANSRILRWIKDDSISGVYRRMRRLKDNGLVNNIQILGMPDLWCLTPAGMAFAGYDFAVATHKMPKYSTIPHLMGVNYVAACLWNNTFNILNLKDFPSFNKEINQLEQENKQGEMLISELEIRSALGKDCSEIRKNSEGSQAGILYKKMFREIEGRFKKWEAGGFRGLSPEFERGNEACWVLYPKNELDIYGHHVPDLVVRRQRKNGKPKSIAIEVELTDKLNDETYRKILKAYKDDNRIYEKVIWITNNNRIANKIHKIANDIKMTNGTIDIRPFYTKEGKFQGKDIWLI